MPSRSLLTAALLLIASFAARAATPDWQAIVSVTGVKLPAPQEKVIWRTDLQAALLEAQSTGRPLFVTLRCLPCKQCAAFDKDVLEGGGDLDPLLKQFITVRLIDAGPVDLRLLPMETFQDMDLSWWGYFLAPEGNLYAIFGGRDDESDATRISKAALVNTLKRVLDHHYAPGRKGWNVDGPAPLLVGDVPTPKQLPGYASWRDRGVGEVKAQTCLHCHQVSEVLRQPAIDLKTFDKTKDFDVWPLPENVGMKVDRDDGLLVTAITEGSAAAKAGLRPGDRLVAAGGRRLFGQADFRGVLHRGPKAAGSVGAQWLRDGKVMSGSLDVADGWRKTVLFWRTTVSGGNVGAGPDFFPLPLNAARRKALGIPAGKMAIEPYVGKRVGALQKAGVKGGEALVAMDGDRTDHAGRQFLTWFRMRHEPGDEVTATILGADGKERDVKYRVGHGE